MNDNTSFTGIVNICLFDEKGILKETRICNLVVTAGKVFICSRMAGTSSAVMSHMAVGTGNTAANVADTTLQTELTRVALDTAGGTPSSNNITYNGTYPAGTATGAITEAGILNNSSGGTLLARTVFSTINKGAGDSMTIAWTITAN